MRPLSNINLVIGRSSGAGGESSQEARVVDYLKAKWGVS